MMSLPPERTPVALLMTEGPLPVSFEPIYEAKVIERVAPAPAIVQEAAPVVVEEIALAPAPVAVEEVASLPVPLVVEAIAPAPAVPLVVEAVAPAPAPIAVEPELVIQQEVETPMDFAPEVMARQPEMVPEIPDGDPKSSLSIQGNAWILGLEPVPVVEVLPEEPVYAAVPTNETVILEHRPQIAEGAPLPDMIEISLEPAAAGLQVTMAPVPEEPRPVLVNEGPVPAVQTEVAHEPIELPPAVVAAEPAAVPAPVPTVPLLVQQATGLEFYSDLVGHPAKTRPLVPNKPVAPLPVAPAAMSAEALAAQAAEAARVWASFEVQPASNASERITLRPLPRTCASDHSLPPRRTAQFGQPLSSTMPKESVTGGLDPEKPRRILPQAPVSGPLPTDQKSWLNFWK